MATHIYALMTATAHTHVTLLSIQRKPGCKGMGGGVLQCASAVAERCLRTANAYTSLQFWTNGTGGGGQGLAWSPTHSPSRLPYGTRLGGPTRFSSDKAYRTVDRPQTPRWRSRAGDAAVPVCMCPCVSEARGLGLAPHSRGHTPGRWRGPRAQRVLPCQPPSPPPPPTKHNLLFKPIVPPPRCSNRLRIPFTLESGLRTAAGGPSGGCHTTVILPNRNPRNMILSLGI